MNGKPKTDSNVRLRILDSAIFVFGKYGIKKTTVEELARAADLSKPGLYLHFSGKDEIYIASIERYLDQGLLLVQEALELNLPVQKRMLAALESWFGRHKEVFSDDAFDVFTTGNKLTEVKARGYQKEFKRLLVSSISDDSNIQFSSRQAVDIVETLFVCGLSWKEYGLSRSEFSKRMKTCVRVCLRQEGPI